MRGDCGKNLGGNQEPDPDSTSGIRSSAGGWRGGQSCSWSVFKVFLPCLREAMVSHRLKPDTSGPHELV